MKEGCEIIVYKCSAGERRSNQRNVIIGEKEREKKTQAGHTLGRRKEIRA